MNEVGKFFADAFRHMGGNRGVPAIEGSGRIARLVQRFFADEAVRLADPA